MNVVTGWDVFEDMRDAQDELLRLNRLRAQGQGLLGQYYGAGIAKAAWAPALDITERKDAYLVAVELPGVGIDDLEITFQDGLLTIQGERHDAHNSSEEKVHRIERRYGPFLRSITLPSHVMADAIEASAHDGVLQILVPKAAEVQAKRIHVRASQKHADPAPALEGKTSN
ncbi:MAG TPA: Hsp20/alpha crystallin family protein [Candidatus Limnocylindrales bacterium]|nr:Hsp20/alpha crystallin family protein [Candidatus Limnocylindrales bacterium]